MKTISVRTRWMLGAALFALPMPAIASDVHGTVADATGTRTLEGTQLTLVELGRTAEADTDGNYRFPDVPAGTYTLRAQYQDAPLFEERITVPADGSLSRDIALGTADEILVIGQQANLFSALSRQRAADGVESVLTRDAVGQFPDQNVAESLRRLPGINVLNDQGEGRFVSVRGLDPNLNSSSVNGLRIPAPESDVREVALDVVSSDLIDSIEVKKTLTPDMDADTIGGSIEINTTSAFDRKKDLFTAKVEGSYNDKRDTLTPKAGFDFSKKLGKDFGVSGGFSYYLRKFSTDNVETGGWDLTDDGIAFTDEPEYRDYDVTRKRISGTLSFDWRPSDTTTLYAKGLFSQFDDQEFRNRLTFSFDEDPSSGTDDSASWSDADGEIKIERDLKDRFERQRIRSLTLGGTTDADAWKFTYQGGWTKSSETEHGSLDPTRFSHKFEDEGLGVTFDYSDPHVPHYSIDGGNDLFLDHATYEFDKIERTALSNSQDEQYSLKGDIARTVGMDTGEFTVQAGVKSRWRTKMYDSEVTTYDGYDGALTFADLLGEQSYSLADIRPVFDWYKTRSFFYDNQGDFEVDQESTVTDGATDDYKAREDVFATYALGRWDSDMLRVIGGVRMERTYNRLNGNLVSEFDDPADGPCDFAVCVAPVDFERHYTQWLPSLNIRFSPGGDGFVLRGGVYRSLMRPNLSDLAPRFAINEDDEAEVGNPFLEPYKSWNFDGSVEYYFARNGAISANIFHKEIDDFIVSSFTDTPGSYNGVAYEELTVPVNGETAHVTGVELSFSQVLDFLPGALDGLLVQLNYTFTDARGTVFTDGEPANPRDIPLPAASRNTFNAVLGYEKGPVSLRLAGTFRDKYLDELGDAAEEDRYVQSHFQLDASARLKVTHDIQLFADFININDAPYFAYQTLSGRRRLLQYEDYNWTAKFGAKVTF